MNKAFSSIKSSLFEGKCKTCGEVYEARSAVEDLEGLTFKCKKSLCEGSVSLQVSKKQSDFESLNKHALKDKPRRYC